MSKSAQEEVSDKKIEGFLKFLNIVYKKPSLLKNKDIYDIARKCINDNDNEK